MTSSPRKNPFFRNTMISIGMHMALVALALIMSVTACIRRRQPRELTTFVELHLEMPTPEPPPPEPAPAPPPPAPAPAPPPPAPIPEPTPAPTPPPRPKPKIEVSRKVVQRPPANAPRAPTEDQLRRMLEDALPRDTRPAASTAEPAFEVYLTTVRNVMYRAWQQPGAPAVQRGLVTRMTIRVRRNGAIVSRSMSASSGNAVMDASVRRAVDSVKQLPPLPAGVGGDHRDITVDFELTDLL